MKKTKLVLQKLAIFTLSIVLTCAFAEVAVRVISMRRLVYNIEMVKYAKYLKERDPQGEVSHIHRKEASAKLMGAEIILNSMGHRNPDLPPKKEPGSKRLLVLGSSVTMGWGVDYPQVFTAVVEKRLNTEKPLGNQYRFKLINAGIGNYNSDLQYKLFERQYPMLRPDMVVLHYFINDAEPTADYNNNPIFKHSYLATYLYDWFQGVRFRFVERTNLVEYYKTLYKEDSPSWQATLSHVEQMKKRTESDGIPFLVMVVPDFHNLQKDSPYQGFYKKVQSSFQQRGIRTVNMFPAFQKRYGTQESELWIQLDDPHPNAKGHSLMADLLYEYLVKTDPLQLKAEAVGQSSSKL